MLASDIRYNPKDDEEEISDDDQPAPLRSNRMQTRSMTRKQKQAQRQSQQQYKFVNVEFDNIRLRMKTRDEFMHEIFGHRRDLDIFNVDQFIKYQKDDNLLNIVRALLTTPNEQRTQEDLDFVQQWDPYIFAKLELDQLRIHQGVLQASNWVDLEQRTKWCDVVPFNIRGKLMDYAHHNLQLHHFYWRQTFDNLDHKYWWGTMKRDVREFCDSCISCQFVKGSVRHRAPLRERHLPKPREHIFADFLGSVFGKYYILVLVDYATGYTMLIPTNGNDAITVVDSILRYWIPIFGWFSIFESDWGPGFNSLIMKALTKATTLKLELAEPRNHRSIGKVERIIGFLQKILNQYNLLLNEKWTNNQDQHEDSWQTIETILPFIQLAMNQRRPRFTTFSPNMLMFGSQLHDLSDIDRIQCNLDKFSKENNMKKEDYQYLRDLFHKLDNITKLFKNDWIDYVWLSNDEYKKRWRITVKSTKAYRQQFKPNTKVLYYIGDKRLPQNKWRTKWTGPWLVHQHLNDSTLIIVDPSTGNKKRVSFDRIKKFNSRKFRKYSDYVGKDDAYLQYQEKLLETLSNYKVQVREQDFELDYDKPA